MDTSTPEPEGPGPRRAVTGACMPIALPPSMPCAAVHSRDPGRWLQQQAAALLPRQRTACVRNAAGWPIARPSTFHAQEACAVADAAGAELIGWGAALGFARLLAAADQWVPGCAVPYVAYQGYQALSAAGRGDLLRTLQTLPIGALVPEALACQLGAWLRTVLPARFGTALGHPSIVIGLACCALLHALLRPGAARPVQGRSGRLLLQLLRTLRAGTNVLEGLQSLFNAGCVPLDATRRLAGPPLGTHQRPGVGGGVAALPLPATAVPWSGCLPSGCSLAPAQASTTVAGVAPASASTADARHPSIPLARRGKAGGRSAPVPKTPPSSPARGGVLSRPLFKVSRIVPRLRAHAGAPAAASVGSGAGGAADGGGFGAVGGNVGNPEQESRYGVRSGKKAKPLRPAVVATPTLAAARKGRARASQPPQREPAQLPRAESRTAATPVAVHEAMAPQCVRFRNTRDALRQVRQGRWEATPLRFCMHDRARAAFAHVFDEPPHDQRQRDWMVTLPLRERITPALRDAGVRRYNGSSLPEQMFPPAPTALADDEIQTVVTLSLVPGARLKRHAIDEGAILQRNSFTVLQHHELDGDRRLILGWFLHRPSTTGAVVKAGLQEIVESDGAFQIEDPESGYALSASHLGELVIGLERLTGCRHLPSARLPAGHRSAAWMIPALQSLNLFVAEEDTHPTHPAGMPARFDSSLRLFDPVTLALPWGGSATLLRTCFALMDRQLVFVDDGGHPRAQQLVFESVGRGPYLPVRYGGFTEQFLHAHGLQRDQSYTATEIIEILQNHGLSWIPTGRAAVGGPAQRARDRHLLPPAPLPWAFDNPGDEGDEPQPLSTFRIDAAGVLHYVDADGSMGLLRLACTGRLPRNIKLADDNAAAALAFARGNGILPGDHYTETELIDALAKNGYVEDPPLAAATMPASATVDREAVTPQAP